MFLDVHGIIQTKRLVIRPWRETDVIHYLTMSRDIGYNCFSPPGFLLVKNDSEAQERVNLRLKLYSERKLGLFPVFLEDSGEFIGCCGLRPYELNGVEE